MSKMSNVIIPEKCWVRNGRTYVLKTPNMPSFPQVSVEYETVLRKNNIPHKKGVNRFGRPCIEYWNPEFYEEKEITLPLFVFISCDKSYIYSGRNYSGKIPTDETYEKAQKMSWKVNLLIEEYEKENAIIRLAQKCKESLNGNTAVGIELSLNDTMRYGHELTFTFEGDKFWYSVFAGYRDIRYAVIFKLSKIEPETIVTMKVPRGKEGLFIGSRGYYVKRWASQLGVQRINVKS